MRSCSVNCCDCNWSVGRLRNCCLVWLDDGLRGCAKPWMCLWCSTAGQQSWDLSFVKKKVTKNLFSREVSGILVKFGIIIQWNLAGSAPTSASSVDLCGCCCSNKSKMECCRWHESHNIILLKEAVPDELQLSLNKVSSQGHYVCGRSFRNIQFCSMSEPRRITASMRRGFGFQLYLPEWTNTLPTHFFSVFYWRFSKHAISILKKKKRRREI